MDMPKTFKEKIALSGLTVLSIGIALLIFTFVSAYSFLTADLQAVSSQDLGQNFGEGLAMLIAASIRVMFLGVMGWMGSLITLRGVTIIANAPKTEMPNVKKPKEPQPKAQPQQAKAKPQKEAKPEQKSFEPELVAIPLEEIEQQPQDSQKPS